MMPHVVLTSADSPTAECYSDLESVQASAVDFEDALAHFLDATRGAAGDTVEIAGADLLRQAVALARMLRRSLSTFRVQYAFLWARADWAEEDEPEQEPHVASALDSLVQELEALVDTIGEVSVGRSGDGTVSVRVDGRMKLVDLDFEPDQLQDPGYKAAVIEAVNAGIEPAARRRRGIANTMLVDSEPSSEGTPGVDLDEPEDPIFFLLDALCVVEEVQNQLAQLLPLVSGAEDLKPLMERIDEIEEISREAEELLRDHLPSAYAYRDLLYVKDRIRDLTEDDLDEVEGCRRLFLDADLDELDEPVTVPGVDLSEETRELIALCAGELQRQEDARESLLLWQSIARRTRSQVAEVERQTFEGRSRDGSVVARVSGVLQLVDLTLESAGESEPADARTAAAEAINSAIEAAMKQRTMAALIEPP